ncbi:unnamed protein product [Phytomonas sp. Hart1]|nr:unnamed protein product [Phytomonas sp. Hart1]|eukprot:CCW68426.1 unnamed protein product [Phytomonas sp. isolate Hart1]
MQWEDIIKAERGSPAGIPTRPALSCICSSMEALVNLPLPGLHSHLCFNLQSGDFCRKFSRDKSTKGYSYTARPAFWGHYGALSMACSVVSTLLLGSDTPSAVPFVVGLYTKDISHTPGAVVASSAVVKLKTASFADSRAATMLFTAALSATVREFTARFNREDCVVLNLTRIGKDQGEDVSRLLGSASFFMIATITEAGLDSREVLELVRAWQDRVLQTNTRPIPIARLMLLQCSTNMMLDALKAVVDKILEGFPCPEEGAPMQLYVDYLQAGVIDIDPLSTSFVGYTLIELSWR